MLQHNIMLFITFIIDIIDPCANSGCQALLSPEGPGYEAREACALVYNYYYGVVPWPGAQCTNCGTDASDGQLIFVKVGSDT